MKMPRKKILFIVPWLPYPLVTGGHQAIFNGILAVKDVFDVYITYKKTRESTHPEDRKGFLKKIPNAHLLPLEEHDSRSSRMIRMTHYLKRVLSNIFRIRRDNDRNVNEICENWISIHQPPAKLWADHLERICNQYKFDIIQVEMPKMISNVLCLPNDSLKIHVHHELGFVRRQLESRSFPTINNYTKSCKTFADINEISQLNMYDMVMTLSPVDLEKLNENGVNVPLKTSFAKVDTDRKYDFSYKNGKILSFVGGDSHSPNISAITWFLEECWGDLRKKDPEYKLQIIGRWHEFNINKIKAKYIGVDFLGFVDDLHKALTGSIMIVPIRVGSGIRMKILEACSMSIPFISTTIGAEGIPVKNGEHCFIADEAVDFVRKIEKLKDRHLQEAFTSNSYEMVKEKYSLEALRSNRLRIYEELLILKKSN